MAFEYMATDSKIDEATYCNSHMSRAYGIIDFTLRNKNGQLYIYLRSIVNTPCHKNLATHKQTCVQEFGVDLLIKGKSLG